MENFDDNYFDVITAYDVIEHISNHKKALLQLKRILRPGGILVISTDYDDGPWSKPYMAKLIRATLILSSEGRAYRLIKKVEKRRKKMIKIIMILIST